MTDAADGQACVLVECPEAGATAREDSLGTEDDCALLDEVWHQIALYDLIDARQLDVDLECHILEVARLGVPDFLCGKGKDVLMSVKPVVGR